MGHHYHTIHYKHFSCKQKDAFYTLLQLSLVEVGLFRVLLAEMEKLNFNQKTQNSYSEAIPFLDIKT